jgi:hypothetical protein
MKNSIRDTCIDFLKNEDIKRDLKAVIQPIGQLIYNEIYVYLLLICIYHVVVVLVLVTILYLVITTKPKFVLWENTDI